MIYYFEVYSRNGKVQEYTHDEKYIEYDSIFNESKYIDYYINTETQEYIVGIWGNNRYTL
jgi:hypothetical protein